MFRQRVVESLPPAPPRWQYDPDFELDFHVRRVTAPDPGNLDAVLELAKTGGDGGLRPSTAMLWKVTLIDGLGADGGKTLCGSHHALTDGVGGVQIAYDPVRSDRTLAQTARATAGRTAGTARLLAR